MNAIERSLSYKLLREIKNSIIHTAEYGYSMFPRIRMIVHDHFCDKELGIETAEPLYHPDVASTNKDGLAYFPSDYVTLEKIVGKLDLRPDDVAVDIGSGKGRVVFFLATRKIAKSVGIEVRKDLVDAAETNKARFKFQTPTVIQFRCEDALYFNPDEYTVFFFFNPFGYKTFKPVIENIKQSFDRKPRNIRIAYYNPAYAHLLDEQSWLRLTGEIQGTKKIFIWQSVI